jgi:[ribosomal protein S18]-alanine N-acetyltransferase
MEMTPVPVVDSTNGKQYLAQPMTVTDLDQVVALEKKLFHPPWSRKAFATELADQPCSFSMVIKNGDCVIAYMVVYFIFEEAHLANIAVAPEYQQRGLGEWMIRHLVNLAEQSGRQIILLEVRMSNDKAIRLYQKLGFVEAGVRKRYYEDKEDARLMNKILSVQRPEVR